MENEMLKVFDENHQPIGQAPRAEGDSHAKTI